MAKKKKKAARQVVVFVTLVSVLSLTSALLLAIAPDPLRPDSGSSLYAIDEPASMGAIFQTQVPTKPNSWKYIYIHHSRTAADVIPGTNQAVGMTDHFVIGNGDGVADGQVQVCSRWDQQLSAAPPQGATNINPNCISICLVGDFDHSVPTPMQIHRLNSLVNALQLRLGIREKDVLLLAQPSSAAGMGQYFPITAFREQLSN